MNNDIVRQNDRMIPSPFVNPAIGSSAVVDSSGASFDLGTILRILHQWRWLILGATAAGLLAGLLATLLTKPMYRASVTLEVDPPTIEILDEKKH